MHFMVLVKKVMRRCRMLKTPASSYRYMAHCRKAFAVPKPRGGRNEPVILMELNQLRSAHIAYAYLAQVLTEQECARLVAYLPQTMPKWWIRLFFLIERTIKAGSIGVYHALGADGFFEARASRAQKREAAGLFDRIWRQLETKADIEALTIDGVVLGDLFYDTYLKTFSRPTIDKAQPEFINFLLECLGLYVFWRDYFNSHDVRAINVSHCVYNLAIPLRIAVARGIPAYQVSATHVYRLSSENLFAYNDFKYFRERFRALPVKAQTAGIAEAKRRIARRFGGEIGVDMVYSSKSAYGPARHERLLRESPRKKILIATHCFFDSPHSYGNNVFPDFYEWLDFLGQMSERTDYDWYIKTHPDYLPGTMEIIQGFIAKYPKFALLPSDASHHQIVDEGVNVTLTVYGTIGFEYAALGVPVINASQVNPHIAYDFNVHAKNVDDYMHLLMKVDSLGLSIDRQSICEYYFMRYIFNTEDLFFERYERMVSALGGYRAQFEPAVYDLWCDEWTPTRHAAILDALKKFVRSGDFRMDYTHFGRVTFREGQL